MERDMVGGIRQSVGEVIDGRIVIVVVKECSVAGVGPAP
jgi:hypothetical protein